jgi:hypothetical protein
MMVVGSKVKASASAELMALHRFVMRPGDLVEATTFDKVEMEDSEGVVGGILDVIDVMRYVWFRPLGLETIDRI